jgi:hypothetical protein
MAAQAVALWFSSKLLSESLGSILLVRDGELYRMLITNCAERQTVAETCTDNRSPHTRKGAPP